MEKYIYGVNIKKGKSIISVTDKEKWLKDKSYSNIIEKDLIKTLESLGYYFSKRNCQFEKESEDRNIEEIISDLNNISNLEHNEEFNNFSLKYICSFFKSKEAGNVFILCVTPKIYWLNNHCLSDNQPDSYITDFIENLGFLEFAESTYSLPKKRNKESNEIKDKIDNFKYLEFNDDFEDFMNDVY